MRKNKIPIKRFERKLAPKKVILVVCEGKKTEPNYFNQLKNFLKLTNVSVSVVSSSSSAASLVVRYAEQKSDETNEYDEIYCVFDGDKCDETKKALRKANNIKSKLGKGFVFKTIVSDPCFEFWILCHFTATTQHFGGASPCHQVQNHKDFKKNLLNYSKDYDFRELIEQHLQTAIKNANQINEVNLQARQTPYTEVVELVERLQNLVKNDKKFI